MWEYRVSTQQYIDEEKLNEYGFLDWEAVGIYADNRVLFKRRKALSLAEQRAHHRDLEDESQ